MFEKFIKATNEYTTKENLVPAPYIRKEFDLDFDACSARIYVCTPGFYDLYVNGKKITKNPFFLGVNIDNVQNIPCHFEQSEKSRRVPWQSSYQRAKCKLAYNFSASAAELNGKHKVPARDPSALRFVGMTPTLRFLCWWTTAISLPFLSRDGRGEPLHRRQREDYEADTSDDLGNLGTDLLTL